MPGLDPGIQDAPMAVPEARLDSRPRLGGEGGDAAFGGRGGGRRGNGCVRPQDGPLSTRGAVLPKPVRRGRGAVPFLPGARVRSRVQRSCTAVIFYDINILPCLAHDKGRCHTLMVEADIWQARRIMQRVLAWLGRCPDGSCF
jgi:hypothetical protein